MEDAAHRVLFNPLLLVEIAEYSEDTSLAFVSMESLLIFARFDRLRFREKWAMKYLRSPLLRQAISNLETANGHRPRVVLELQFGRRIPEGSLWLPKSDEVAAAREAFSVSLVLVGLEEDESLKFRHLSFQGVPVRSVVFELCNLNE